MVNFMLYVFYHNKNNLKIKKKLQINGYRKKAFDKTQHDKTLTTSNTRELP